MFKYPTLTKRFHHLLGTLLAIGGLNWTSVSAQAVDNELVFLIDSSGLTSATEFDSYLNVIANSFETGPLVDALADGQLNSLATSVVLFGGTGQTPDVAIPEFQITDATSAAAFASSVRAVSDTIANAALFPAFQPALGAAIEFATEFILTNTTSSQTQSIQLFADFIDLGGTLPFDTDLGLQNTIAASDAAQAAGIDSLTTIFGDTLEVPANAGLFPTGASSIAEVQTLFEESVVFGQPEGTSGFAIIENDNADASIDPQDQAAVTAIVSQAVTVPEPSVLSLLGILLLSFMRRKR